MSQPITSANSYTRNDYDSLSGREDQTTSKAMNEIAAHAGTTRSHALRGDDRTEREIHAATKDVGHNAKELGVTVGKELIEHGAEHVVEHAVAVGFFGSAAVAAALGGGAVVEMLSMMKAVGEDGIAGHERAEALTKDTMHASSSATSTGSRRTTATRSSRGTRPARKTTRPTACTTG